MIDVGEAITQAHREEWARVVASLAERSGNSDITEDATAEAVAIAVVRVLIRGGSPSLYDVEVIRWPN